MSACLTVDDTTEPSKQAEKMRRLHADKLYELFQTNTPFVSVTLLQTIGSVPQSPGARMLVTAAGHHFGTIGGSILEQRAVEICFRLLKQEHAPAPLLVSWGLIKDLGMPCGGSVKLYFEVCNMKSWKIVIFGGGHVGAAVINLLSRLECSLTCIDTRKDWLDRIPDSANLKKICTNNWLAEINSLESSSFVLILTPGYASDSAVLAELLSFHQPPYVGVIGSKAKAARLKQDLIAHGLSPDKENSFYCPVGLGFGSKDPEELAVSIVAQLIEKRDERLLKLAT